MKNQFDKNNNRHGLWERTYPNGKLDYKAYYINGISHGKYESYTITGKLFLKCRYYYGNKIGLVKSYDGDLSYYIR